MNTNYNASTQTYRETCIDIENMRRCPAVQAVDITYSLYFGSCIYLGKQETPITDANILQRKKTTTVQWTKRNNIYFYNSFFFSVEA